MKQCGYVFGRNPLKRTWIDKKHKVFKSKINIFSDPLERALNPYGKGVWLSVYKQKSVKVKLRNLVKIAEIKKKYPDLYEHLMELGIPVVSREYVELYRIKFAVLLDCWVRGKVVHHMSDKCEAIEDDHILNLLLILQPLHERYHQKPNDVDVLGEYNKEVDKRNALLKVRLISMVGEEDANRILGQYIATQRAA